jgi:MYXO-CTERM domain-containing protein
MKTSRIGAVVVGLLALFAAGHARADGATGGTTATVLNTYSKVWVNGDNLGPNRIGQDTGAGIMDGHVAFRALPTKEVLVATSYTRSDSRPNAENSYMQGGVAVAKITDKGVVYGQPFDLPRLNDNRAWMRPQTFISDDGKKVIAVAASESNGLNNNNPMPCLFVLNVNPDLSLSLAQIPNSTRNNINLPTNLIQTALNQGINVPNPENQRGPHSAAQIGPNTWAVGMQYNNQAHEAFAFSVGDDNTVTMKWLRRYSNNAQHCRPQVAFDATTNTLYSTAVEANEQPAEIGFRLVAIDPATGLAKQGLNKVVVRSQPNQNKYVSEPSISVPVGGTVAIGWAMTSKARQRNGNNGHAGGGQVAQLALFDGATLAMKGTPISAAAPYGRHAHTFATKYGPNGDPAIAYIGGSSTGTGAGKQLIYPLTAQGALGVKDYGKMYTVSLYSDVANVQARGKDNPNNQAKGFINGVGDVPNPGFDVANGFMPEVKAFTLSVVTGYTDQAAAQRGLKNSLWLSLTPAAWKEGIQTVPGTPTPTPGTNPDGTGSLPKTQTTTPTNPQGDQSSTPDTPSVTEGEALEPGYGENPAFADTASGCNVSRTGGPDMGGLALLALGAVALVRRKKEGR